MRSNDEFESKEELYFSWYLEELEERKVVESSAYQPPFELSGMKLFDELKCDYTKTTQLKTKIKTEEKTWTVLRSHSYTPDWAVVWNQEYKGIIYSDIRNGPGFPFYSSDIRNVDHITLIEIKGQFDRHNMTRLFRINQKWVYQKYGMFINLIQIPELFKDTFVPERYLLTDSGKQRRKISFEIRTIDEFLNTSV